MGTSSSRGSFPSAVFPPKKSYETWKRSKSGFYYIYIYNYIYITTGYGPLSVPYLIYVVEVRQGKSNDMGPAINSPSFEHTYAL